MIRFRFNPQKAVQAVEWMLARAGEPVDFHTLLKAFYFADKAMLNTHGRPIFGATYRAMNYGPVPTEVYEMLKREPIWLTELDGNGYPWEQVNAYHVQRRHGHNGPVSTDEIAPAELDLLRHWFDRSRLMTFNMRTRETHGFDWSEGMRRPSGQMAYEDMIDPARPGREDLIEDLEAMGPRIVL